MHSHKPRTIRVIGLGVVLASLSMLGGATGQEAVVSTPACTEELTIDRLLHMSQCELEEVYRNAQPGTIEEGFHPGIPIFVPGTGRTVMMAKGARPIWQGKHIDLCEGVMTNSVCGLKIIKARISDGESWLDGKPSIIMDYCGMSRFAGAARDEIRQISPCLHLGIMYIRKPCGPKFSMFFVLETKPTCCH